MAEEATRCNSTEEVKREIKRHELSMALGILLELILLASTIFLSVKISAVLVGEIEGVEKYVLAFGLATVPPLAMLVMIAWFKKFLTRKSIEIVEVLGNE